MTVKTSEDKPLFDLHCWRCCHSPCKGCWGLGVQGLRLFGYGLVGCGLAPYCLCFLVAEFISPKKCTLFSFIVGNIIPQKRIMGLSN